MKNKIALIACAVSMALGAGTALADKGGNGHGNKHEKHAQKHAEKQAKHAAKHGYVRNDQVAYFDSNSANIGCPPGLAKKGNGCLPPGQAKKAQQRYHVGQPLPPGVTYAPVQQNVLVTLPPVQPGYRYVRVGNDILLLQQGGLIANILAGLG